MYRCFHPCSYDADRKADLVFVYAASLQDIIIIKLIMLSKSAHGYLGQNIGFQLTLCLDYCKKDLRCILISLIGGRQLVMK